MSDWIPIRDLLAIGRLDDHPVAFDGDVLYRFGAFRELASRYAASLPSGPSSTDALPPTVALFYEDAWRFAAALLGAWTAGYRTVLLNDSSPATLDSMAASGTLVLGESEPGPSLRTSGTVSSLDPEFACAALYTSGSSGPPVLIHKQLRHLEAELSALETRFGGQVRDGHVRTTVSHQHMYGLVFRLLWPLCAGRPFDAKRRPFWADLFSGGPASAVVLVTSPAHLGRLPDSIASRRGPVLTVFSSGSPLSAAAADKCRSNLGTGPIEIYGSSETGAVASREGLASTPWRVLPGTEAWVGHEQRLCVQSDQVAEAFVTSDRALSTEDGFMLLGRIDRLVKVEGARVSLASVESELMATGQVHHARVLFFPADLDPSVATDGAAHRDRLGAVIVPTAAGCSDLATMGRAGWIRALRAMLGARIEPIAVPRRFRLVDSLPGDPLGKTGDADLRRLFELPADTRFPPGCLVDRSDGTARVTLAVAAELPVFDGHFPGRPILPGVAQLGWVIATARRHLEEHRPVAAVFGLKFRHPIHPGTVVQLEVSRRGPHVVGFTIDGPNGPVSFGQLAFGEPASGQEGLP